MIEVGKNIFEFIANIVNEYPLLAFLILICLVVCLVRLVSFFFERVSNNFLGIFACLGQSLPLAMVIYFKDFILANWGNSTVFITFFDIFIFIILATQIHIYISRGPTPPERNIIVTLGTVGIIIWILLFFQTFAALRFWEQLPPPQQSPPTFPPGRG